MFRKTSDGNSHVAYKLYELNKYFQCLVHSNQVLDAIIIIIVIINYSSSSRNWSEAHHNMNLLRSCLFSRATQLSPLGTPSSALDGAALASPKATQAPSCSLTWEKPERNTWREGLAGRVHRGWEGLCQPGPCASRTANREKDRVDGGGPWANPSALPHFLPLSLWTQVIFRNEVTNEFLYYVVSFKVIPSGIIKTIEMVSPVRQSTSASIKVENPLPYSVTFSTECRVPDISLPSQFVVPANSEVWPCLPGAPRPHIRAGGSAQGASGSTFCIP